MSSTALSPKPKTPHPTSHQGRSPSPSYFGLSVSKGSPSHSSGARHLKDGASPSSSSVRSTAVSPPQNLPLLPNPRPGSLHSQPGRSAFSLNRGGVSQYGVYPSDSPLKGRSEESATSDDEELAPSRPGQFRAEKSNSINLGEVARYSRSPKRLHSHESIKEELRQAREASPNSSDVQLESQDENFNFKRDEKHPRLSPSRKKRDGLPSGKLINRVETLPAQLNEASQAIRSPEHIAGILEGHAEDVLILDLRVSTQYARSRVRGALNLCVPTTLLKRTTYTVTRLAESFKDDAQRKNFDRWSLCKSIITYEAHTETSKETTSCFNVLKKFALEGFKGDACIIQGGFNEFCRKFPNYIEKGSGIAARAASISLPLNDSDRQALPPVIGGCPMPSTKDAINPFFNNIRQNQDLIGGVGQMPIKRPRALDAEKEQRLPKWLKVACDERDKGKTVSEKFFKIEKREQRRMQKALGGAKTQGTPDIEHTSPVQIAGLEKGDKNRYNNIWPFEHSRVKLQDVDDADCDYVNANFVDTKLSNKRYIATQGPIPATFEDFWKMIWEHDVRVIVMLTAEKEGNQIKAHNYWKDRRYGQLKLNFLSERRASLDLVKIHQRNKRPSVDKRQSSELARRASEGDSVGGYFGLQSSAREGNANGTSDSTPSEQPFIIVRKFTISHEKYPFERMREITHLQYSSWPDFGAPAHPTHLLGLVEQTNAVVRMGRSSTSYSSQSKSDDPSDISERPVVVHCSAGCGRTGTFCTVDAVIDMLKRQRKADSAQAAERGGSPMDIDSPLKGSTRAESIDAVLANGNQLEASQKHANSRPQTGEPSENLWLSDDGIDLIERTVNEFRLRRLSMVQSLRQFVLCYETVLEWIVRQESPQTA